MTELVLGVDLGGTDTKFAVLDRFGTIVRKEKFPTEALLPVDEVIKLLADRIRLMIGDDKVLGVGLGVPSPVNSKEGLVYHAPNLGRNGWINVPVIELLRKHLGDSLQIDLNNDANAAAWGEYWCGIGRGTDTMILFTLGTGVGGGIIVNGKLHVGGDDAAGELGHMVIEIDGEPCGCGNLGCLEAYASATAIKRMVREALEDNKKTSIVIPEKGIDYLGAKAVFDAAAEGDAVAKNILSRLTHALGVACGNMIHIFNPDMIAFSGGIAAAGDILFDPIRDIAKKMAFERPGTRCKIIPASLGNDAGVIGNAGLVFVNADKKN